MPKPRSADLAVYNVRLLRSLDKLLRDKPRYAGELSTSINDALLAVDLGTVELVKLHSREKQTGQETQVVILRRLRKRIHDVARNRNCSMNQLVNSALLAYYQQGGDMVRVRGLTYTCTPAETIGKRNSDLKLDRGHALEAGKSYKVAGWASVNQQFGKPVWDVFADYLRSGETLLPNGKTVTLQGVDGNPGIAG